MEDKKILAKDARTIANSTNSLLNHVYKTIREASKEGVVTLSWNVYTYSKILVDKVINELVSCGYHTSISYCKDRFDTKVYDTLTINW